MNQELKDVLEFGIFFLTGGTVAYGLIKHGFRTIRENYRTKNERINAVKDLMESEGFKEHIEKRESLTKKMLEDADLANDDLYHSGYIKEVLNSTYGELNFLNE